MMKGCFAFHLLSVGEGAGEGTSMLQSVSVGALKGLAHSARTKQLERLADASKKLESTYGALLQQKVAQTPKHAEEGETGHLENTPVFTDVETQLTALKQELADEKAVNDDLIVQAHDRLTACNTECMAHFTAELEIGDHAPGINALNTLVMNDRTTHHDCRTAELASIIAAGTSCTAFQQNEFAITHQTLSRAKWWTGELTEEEMGGQATLATLTTEATECDTAENDVDVDSTRCDLDQRRFGAAYCTYEQKVTDTCAAHTQCYFDETANLVTVTATVEAYEASQKRVYETVAKVECYIGKLKAAETEQLTVAEFNLCKNLATDTTLLNVDYNEIGIPVKLPCLEKIRTEEDLDARKVYNQVVEEVNGVRTGYYPGEDNWYEQELADFTKNDKIKLKYSIEAPVSCEQRRSEGFDISNIVKECDLKAVGRGCCARDAEFALGDWTNEDDCLRDALAEAECREEGGVIHQRDNKCNCLRKSRECNPKLTGDDSGCGGVSFWEVDCQVTER